MEQVTESALEASSAVARGRAIVLQQNCIACHLPFEGSLHRATDLTLLAKSISGERLLAVLAEGVPGTAMPALGLSTTAAADTLAFLAWLSDAGDDIRARFERLATSAELNLSTVPWFEFE